MMLPHVIIFYFIGDRVHNVALISLIAYVPMVLVLSKVVYNSRLEEIRTHELLEEKIAQLHEISVHDELTKIYNRRYFFEEASKYIAYSRRNNKALSLLM